MRRAVADRRAGGGEDRVREPDAADLDRRSISGRRLGPVHARRAPGHRMGSVRGSNGCSPIVSSRPHSRAAWARAASSEPVLVHEPEAAVPDDELAGHDDVAHVRAPRTRTSSAPASVPASSGVGVGVGRGRRGPRARPARAGPGAAPRRPGRRPRADSARRASAHPALDRQPSSRAAEVRDPGLLEHVGADAVRAQRDARARAAPAALAPDGVVHVRARVVGHRRAGLRDEVRLRRVEVDPVGEQRPLVERTRPGEPLDDRMPNRSPAVALVRGVLGDVDVDAGTRSPRQPSTQAASVSSDSVNEACAPIIARASGGAPPATCARRTGGSPRPRPWRARRRRGRDTS